MERTEKKSIDISSIKKLFGENCLLNAEICETDEDLIHNISNFNFIKKDNLNTSYILSNNIMTKETISINKPIYKRIIEHVSSYLINLIKNNVTEIMLWRYHSVPFINYIADRQEIDLVNKIKEIAKSYNWIIVDTCNYDILKRHCDINETSTSDKHVSKIYKKGTFKCGDSEVIIYITNDICKKNVYFGSTNSILTIINRNLEEEKINHKSEKNMIDYNIEYSISLSNKDEKIVKLKL